MCYRIRICYRIKLKRLAIECILFYHNLLLFRSENVLQFDILPSFPEKLSRLPGTLSI